MSPRLQYLRLCRLFDESLHLFPDFAYDSLTEEIEKDLLIALSQVFRLVKQLTDEIDSDEEVPSEPVDDGECSVDSTGHLDNRCCLTKITGNLMFLLTLDSRYVQHLAGNILVAISEFLLTSDGDWDDYMQLLCLSLELGIYNSLRSSSKPSELQSRCTDYDPLTSRSLKLKLKSASWSAVAAILHVFRNIQKYLKQEFDYKKREAYLDSVISLMLDLPLDLLREIYVGGNIEDLQTGKDILEQFDQPRELTIFFANFIQYVCSLVTQSSFVEGGRGFPPVIGKIINLVPKLTVWCHADVRSPYNVRTSYYFRHKVLMLIIRLSCRTHIEHSVSFTWMHLIHKYFEDLLLLPISEGKVDQDDFLEDSPFSTSIFDPRNQNLSSRHLQRLTIFLFLRCSLNLISTKGSPGEPQCAYGNLQHCHYCSVDLKLDSECCSNSLSLVKLHEWLLSHVPADFLVNDQLYFERCIRFTKSFLQLFMHEDDILFEMLLQLFHVPFCAEQVIRKKPLPEVKKHPILLVSDLFSPIHVFHLFLSEIHYDHQVLLDYLISKDSGSSCAEYLLRTLRTVCNSWSLFVEFPGVQEDLCQLYLKRQKVLADCSDFKGVLYPASVNDSEVSLLNTEHKEGYAHGRRNCRNYRLPFVAARDCLVSLRTSINSLHQKSLFPYNPKVLLRRLMMFQELCISQ